MIIKFLQSPDAEQERLGFRDRPTIQEENSAAKAEFNDTVPVLESRHVVAAYLTEADYRLARTIVPEFSAFKDYEDWLDFRVGMFWGLETAGFSLELVPVDLTEFAIWRRTASIIPSISALDQFARSRDLRFAGQLDREVVRKPS